MTEDQIQNLDDPTPERFDDTEQALLGFADQLTRTGDVDDSTVNRLKNNFSDREVLELAYTVATANFTNRLNHALDVPLEEK